MLLFYLNKSQIILHLIIINTEESYYIYFIITLPKLFYIK